MQILISKYHLKYLSKIPLKDILKVFQGRLINRMNPKITDLKNLKKTSGDIKNIAQRSQIGKVILDEKKSFEKFKPYKCSRKSPTYIATREKIEALIGEIQDESGKDYPFILAGRRSFLARNADLFKICDPLLAEIESVDQDLFIRLYDSAKNECFPTGMGEKEFSKRISDSIEIIREINPDVLTEGVEYDYEYLLGLFDEEMIFQTTVRQQSCFTWAKMKLESIGVEFRDLKMDKIISITRIHLKNHMEEDVLPFQVDDKNPVTIRKREKKTIKHSITYDVDRDRRTENYKEILKKIDKSEKNRSKGIILETCGSTLSVSMIPASFAFGIAFPPSLFVTVPLLFTGAAIAGSGKKIADEANGTLKNIKIDDTPMLESEKKSSSKKLTKKNEITSSRYSHHHYFEYDPDCPAD